MTKPTKADFKAVSELIDKWKEHWSWQYHIIDTAMPIEEVTLDACKDFAGSLFEEYQSHIDKMHQLKAYRWLLGDIHWKRFHLALFKSPSAKRTSKSDFVARAGDWIFKAASPMTDDKYRDYVESSERWIERERSRMREEAYKDEEIEVFIREDKQYKILSIEEHNSESNRLKSLNRQAIDCAQFCFQAPDIEILILNAFGRYFYDPDFLQRFTQHEPDPEDVQEAEEWDENIEKGLQAIDDLFPILEEHLEIAEDFGELAEIDKFKKMMTWLDSFREKLARSHGSIWDDIYNGQHPIGVIRRKDDAARERALGCTIWKIIREYSKSRPVAAIHELLHIEGIFNTPNLRTVERWVQVWDNEWKKELDFRLNLNIPEGSDS